jgi:predicted DNA-binding transcriptional regulator AlpA
MSKTVDQPTDAVVHPGARLLDRRELTAKVNLSYPTVWALMKKGAFPRSVVIGGKTLWLEHEIDQYIARLPRRRLKGETTGVPYRTRRTAAGAA